MGTKSSKRYPDELKARAVQMVADLRSDTVSEWEAMGRVADLLGVGTAETVRKWVRQAEIDAGDRAGQTSEESEVLRKLRRENAELKRANAILKAASVFFAAEAPDRVARHFVAGAPDRLWVADFTYCRTRAGWAYTAFVTDVYARKIVGWKVATEMTQKLVTDAINHAIDTRKRSGATFLDDLIHHSDYAEVFIKRRKPEFVCAA